MEALNTPITFLRPEIGLNPVHEPLIRRNLNANLDNVAGKLSEEVSLALDELWGQGMDSWQEVNLDYTVRRVVARAVNRVFVGPRLCRNNDYIENSIRFATRVSTCGLLINFPPNWLRHPIGFVFKIPIQIAYSDCSKQLLPVFSDLTHRQISPSPHVFTLWLVSNSVQYPLSSPERTPDFLSRRIMALNSELCRNSYINFNNLVRWEKTWKRARLTQMSRLDSALRESMRLWGLVPKGMSRKVMKPGGVILPDGQRLSQGTTVCISVWWLHHDKDIFPRPSEFVHDRFMRVDDEEMEKKISDAAYAAAETNENFVVWGIGKHACPGRFLL
ncbi:hypothetical protein ZTR_04512 [Talaromyces verruculosus]|nr:hypothetical protein ZTR_04512 [Talaromyces verruculosus]